MRSHFSVFNTDQVNRAHIVTPASELIKAEQRHLNQCQRQGIEPGTPVHMQHDMHRLIGWSRTIGHYIDNQMVRVIGIIEEPETTQEAASLYARADEYWEHHHSCTTIQFKEELTSRLAPADLRHATFIQIEAALVKRSGIARELYPNLFTPNLGSTDKDGLTDYRELLNSMRQVQPGVFHDSSRNLLLFAHSFLRRSLSHRNKLNEYFLQSFSRISENDDTLRVRIKLDPDILGHPASAKNLIEQEYWHGPLYSDDISSIPSGVTEHKASERTRQFEGIDKTQIWWKSPETRRIDGDLNSNYRTFEVEELIDIPSAGLGNDHFGCRYAHAEFSADTSAITHFDGAIRAYETEPYLDRIDASIDRAGKQAHYTKLFRVDGKLAIPDWKRLLSDFYRGNPLISEYFGQAEVFDENIPTGSPEETSESPPSQMNTSEIVAMINLEQGTINEPIQVCSEFYFEDSGKYTPYIEIGTGEVARYMRSNIPSSTIPLISFNDGILNLARLRFGFTEQFVTDFQSEIAKLTTALRQEVEAGVVHSIAIPLTWENQGLLVTLSLAGNATRVVCMLEQLENLIAPEKAPSEWIESVSRYIKTSTDPKAPKLADIEIKNGALFIGRSGEISFSAIIDK